VSNVNQKNNKFSEPSHSVPPLMPEFAIGMTVLLIAAPVVIVGDDVDGDDEAAGSGRSPPAASLGCAGRGWQSLPDGPLAQRS
jgi:hypothetical protein